MPEALDAEGKERFDANVDLPQIVARQVARECGAGDRLDDLVGYANEGLFDAALRFDAARGVPFRAYANFRVRGAVLDGVRQMSALPRRAYQRIRALEGAYRVSDGALEDVHAPPPPGSTASDAETALDEHLAGMATAMALGLVASAAVGDDGEHVAAADDDPARLLEDAQIAALVRSAIDDLHKENEAEAELVRRHYLGGEQFDRVARDLKLSKSWASRLHTRALKRLSKRLRALR